MTKNNRTHLADDFRGNQNKWNPIKGFVTKQVGLTVPKGQTVSLSTDDCIQVIWCLKGEYKGKTEEKGEYTISEGNVGVIFPSKRFAHHTAKMPTEYRYLSVGGENAQEECISAGLWGGLTGKASSSDVLLDRIANHLAGDRPSDRISADIATRELLLLTATQVRENASSKIAHDAMHRICWRFTDPAFSISVLQQEMQISRSSLGTHFKNGTGKSPLSYLTEVRLAHAKMLLCETTKRIAIVAQESGFGCPVYFSQIITKHTGLSPRAYRHKFTKKAH